MPEYQWSWKTLFCVKSAKGRRGNIVLFHLHEVPRIGKFMEHRTEVIRGAGDKERKNAFRLTKAEFLLGMMKRFRVKAARRCECIKCHRPDTGS